jgi:hypothetical protein
MAINIPIITSLEDKGIRAAQAAFTNFKTSVAGAEGGMNKFKAGSTAALDAVKANAGNFAIAAGAALVGFAAQGIKAFQELALGAEKFSTATGLAIEDASRYMEVVGDIGIPIDAVSTAIGRLNKTIGADPDKVRDLGVDLVYLKDGSLDVNATFLNTIERIKGIKDPAEKAKVAAQLLGKGWQSMSTLIEMGADDLAESLGNVSGAKVIDPKELKRAKDFRDTMDDFGDTAQDLSIALGQFLIPILTDIIKLVDTMTSGIGDTWNYLQKKWDQTYFSTVWDEIGNTAGMVVDDIKEGFSDIWGMFSDKKEVIPVFAEDMRAAREDTEDFRDVIKQARLDAILPFTTAVDGMSTALMNADEAWKVLTDSLNEEVALDNLEADLIELKESAAKAFGSGAQADIDAYEQKVADFVARLALVAGGMDTISSKEILIRFKTQGEAAAIELARWIARGAEYGGLSAVDALNLAGISTNPVKPQALGGPVMGGTSYLVGEQGPELFTPSSAGNITPNHALGGGGTINITVTSADPNEVVRALQTYVRQSGPVPVNTRTM